MNAPSYFEIQADDLNRALNFYADVFGWKFTKAESLPIDYWRIETNGPRGGLLKRSAARRQDFLSTLLQHCNIPQAVRLAPSRSSTPSVEIS